MKTSLLKLGLVGLFTLGAMTASAKAATTSTSGSGGSAFSLGFSTFGGGALGGANQNAISALWDLSNLQSIQFYVGIPTTSPFSIGGGAMFRHTLMGDQGLGMHVGLGVGLGATGAVAPATGSTFYFDVMPVFGFHFRFLERIRLSFSGGPLFHITPGFQFMVQPLSAMAGAAIHYQL